MLTLVVPGLIWTRQALADLSHDLPLPAFTTLLGRGSLGRLPPQGSEAALAGTFDLPLPLPAAALRRLALRGDGEGDWLCLDPVRLQFHERSLVVGHPDQLRLDAAEAEAFAVSLAPTFEELGRIEVLTPSCWNLRLAAAPPPFADLAEAVGRAAAPLPSGPAHAAWRRAINEAQMVLHAHPVNRERENAGKPPVNSLWPWGGGRLPPVGRAARGGLWSDDPVVLGLARHLGVEGAPLPARYPGSAGDGALALLDALQLPARTGDATAWRDALAALEANWLAPVLDALRSGRLDALRLLAPGDLGSAELRVGRRDLWKFWRKPRPLAELAEA